MTSNRKYKKSFNFKAVIFDLDGTLLDSLAGIADTMNMVLEQQGLTPHPREKYRDFVGDGIKMLVTRALTDQWLGNEKELDSLVEDFRRIYRQVWPKDTLPYAGIKPLLTQLNRQGIKLSVLSNKSQDFTRQMVSGLLKDVSFIEVFGARDSVPRKPDPASTLELAELMQVPASGTLFVGDSHIDMKTAVNAGMVPVGVTWGFSDRENLMANGAQRIIQQPAQLLEILLSPVGLS